MTSLPQVQAQILQTIVNRNSSVVHEQQPANSGFESSFVSPLPRRRSGDPNRPKRPTSAYFFFIQLEREEAARRGERISRVADWTKQVSAKWRSLGAEEKANYNKLAASDKLRYSQQQMADYNGRHRNRPKRPQSAYILWLGDFRAQMKNRFTEHKDLLKAAGEAWRKMSPVDKMPYDQLAQQEKQKYGEALKGYNMMSSYAGKDTNRPKRPRSAYIIWLLDFRAQVKSQFVGNKELLRAAGEEWRKMTNLDKLPYARLAEQEKQKYGEAMKGYNMVFSSQPLNESCASYCPPPIIQQAGNLTPQPQNQIQIEREAGSLTGKGGRPKRPRSAYIIWLLDFRAQMKSRFTENKELLRAAGEEWRRMTTSDKLPYARLAEQEKQKYCEAMRGFNMGTKKARIYENRLAANGIIFSQQQAPLCDPTASSLTSSSLSVNLQAEVLMPSTGDSSNGLQDESDEYED